MVSHSCCHHREFTSWRTREHQCFYRGFEMTSQLLPLTLNERTSHRPSDDAICDLRHDLRRDLGESRWFSFVNTTWLGPRPSLKWDLVRVQAKSWVKSQVKTVSEYGPRCHHWPRKTVMQFLWSGYHDVSMVMFHFLILSISMCPFELSEYIASFCYHNHYHHHHYLSAYILF